MPQVHIADERGLSSAPCFRKVREPYCRARDSRPTCIEDSVEPGHYSGTVRQFHGQWKFTSSPASREIPKIVQEEIAASKRKLSRPIQTAATR